MKKLLILFVFAGLASAQTKIDLANQTKNADFSAFAVARPQPVGIALPGTCSLGNLFFLQTAPGTGTLYSCTATNVWAAISGYSLPQATTTTLGGVIVPTGTGLSVSSGNLGLIYGTGANTVAQGNDTRLVNALLKGNNLSDVTNAATALANLGGVGPNAVNILHGVTFPVGGATNTVPVITSANTITYELLPNASLVNNALTVTAGTGLTGGGSVALGASTSLAVAYGTTAGTAAQGNDVRIGDAISWLTRPLLSGVPTNGQVYQWVSANNDWELGTPGGTGSSPGGAANSIEWNSAGSFAGILNTNVLKGYVVQTNSGTPTFQLLPIPNTDVAPINLASTANGGITGVLPPANGGTGGTVTVPNGGTGATTFLANALLIGHGAAAITALGSIGTTTTVLHGNALGAPSFGSTVLTSDVSGTLPIGNGGTGATTAANAFNLLDPMTTLGDMLIEGVGPTAQRLAGNTTVVQQYLRQTGTGSVSANPNWGAITSIQNNNVTAGTPSNGQVYIWNSGSASFVLGLPSASGTTFSGITTGTNTSATMLCGSGCSMANTGSGTIQASSLLGTGPITILGGIGTAPSVSAGQVGCWYDTNDTTQHCKDASGTITTMVRGISTPVSSIATCNVPQIAYDTNFMYLCVAANTWKRVSLVVF